MRCTGSNGSGVVLLLTGAAACSAPQPERMTYPTTRTGDQVDTYHGVSVADPYRWLEDDTSAETAAWVEAQNKVTFAHLESIPFRAALTARLEQLYNYPKFGEPFRRGTTYFFFKNDGLQNQSVVYRQTGLDGAPEVLLDPEHALARRHDQAERLRGVEGRPPRRLRPERGRVRLADLQGARRDHQAAAHRFGRVGEGVGCGLGRRRVLLQPVSGAREGQGADRPRTSTTRCSSIAWARRSRPTSWSSRIPANPERFHTVETTEDERFLILTVSDRGKGKKGNAVYYRDLAGRDQDVHSRSSPRSATTPST